MVLTLALVLQLCAFLAFVLATIGIAARVNLLALGLALWVLSIIVT